MNRNAIPADIAPFSGRFEGDTHYFACRVYYEDTDFSGIVYHANYLRYFERARSDMLRAIGIDQRAAHEAGHGVYAVADMHIKFEAPAKFDDNLVVMSQVTQIRGASCLIHQRVIRSHEQGPQPIAKADVVAAFLNPQGRPTRQPAAWVQAFTQVLPPHLQAQKAENR